MSKLNDLSLSEFKIDMDVRIMDINYGGHLGHAELIKITHQARLKLFSKYSLKEDNLNGAGIIVRNLSANYQGEAFFDDILHISISIDNIDRASCDFLYKITKNSNVPVATVMEKVLFMNYTTRKIVRTPQVIFNLKQSLSSAV